MVNAWRELELQRLYRHPPTVNKPQGKYISV